MGIAFGAATDAAMTGHVANVAMLSFQERWLRANRRLTPLAPDPQLARTALRRLDGNLGRGVYWSCFTLAFLASFPPLLLANLVPRKSAVAQGCADGGDADRREVAKLGDRVRRPAASPRAAAVELPPVQLAAS